MKKTNLIIFPGNFLPHVGGLETHVDEFCKYLSKTNKYNITLFIPNVVDAKDKETIHNKVKIIRYPAFELVANWPFPKLWSLKFWKLYFGLYKNKYDIVMTRTRFFSNTFLGLFFSKIRYNQIKLIHVEHGSGFVKLESKFKSNIAFIYDKIFGKLIFLMADKTISISGAVQKFIYRNFLNEKNNNIQIIRRGVDFELYKKIKKKESLFENKIKMIFVGRLYKWKGVENSIDAYKLLPKKLQEKSVFIIVGDGEDFHRLQIRAENFLDNGIYFFGERDFNEAISIMKSSDIYVHSAYEGGGLSNSLLQAMQCSLSIIASPNEGANEVIINKNTGILLEDNSKEKIKEAMEILLENNNLRKEYSNNAKKYVKKKFSWQNNIKAYQEVFYEVLK